MKKKLTDSQVTNLVCEALAKNMTEMLEYAEDETTEMYMEYLYFQLLSAGIMKRHGIEKYQNYVSEVVENGEGLVERIKKMQ